MAWDKKAVAGDGITATMAAKVAMAAMAVRWQRQTMESRGGSDVEGRRGRKTGRSLGRT
ncbi:hypothetical protein [Methanothrix harundinacea]|uniref:hypothetical protein n=1 Tax=Methanothrix harundinacea TaxID=301375 RepID=UPI000A82A0FE|nr:hypothetical protein [Methanothrix harundinacea]